MDANWVKKSEFHYVLLDYVLSKSPFSPWWYLHDQNDQIIPLMEHSTLSEKPPLEDAAYAIQDHLLGLKQEIDQKVCMVRLTLHTLKKNSQ